MEYESELAAVLVKSKSDKSGTIEMTQDADGWSFYQFGKLSLDYPSLDDAIRAMKEAENDAT